MKLLTKEQEQSYENAKVSYIYLKKGENKYEKDNHCHCTGEYRDAVHSICNLKYSVPKKFPYLFIMNLIMIIILS